MRDFSPLTLPEAGGNLLTAQELGLVGLASSPVRAGQTSSSATDSMMRFGR